MPDTSGVKGTRNYQLWFGLAIVTLIVLIAIWGPDWAPQDPMQINAIVRFDNEWVAAPFPPFKYTRFPLGSDQNGRDILSQVLWAVRPTMIMVSIVAVVRMVLGLLIGLSAGWLAGRPGRLLNNLISAALSAPVLIVALAVISAVGIDLGVTAFILGLAATGWAETARIVREQTRSIRRMPYIEAARALGQGNLGLLTRHVIRQIAPLIWMLFSFEISGTLITSAALGFLGYYIGGEVWTAVTDTSAIRSSGMPELGLMVATLSNDIFTGPWKMAAAISLICLTILGFNLLGEGLRLRIERGPRRSSPLALFHEQATLWLDHYLWHPLTTAFHRSRRLAAALSLVLLAGLGFSGWYFLRPPAAISIPARLNIPGGHIWSSQLHDPYGTLQTSFPGPSTNPQVLWTIPAESAFTTGPVIAVYGTLYVPVQSGWLAAYHPNGSLAWRYKVEAEPVGAAAISAEGRIYLADKLGGLTAMSSLGQPLWHFQPPGEMPATSGPIVDHQGNIYYLRAGLVEAVSPQGSSLWSSQARNYRTIIPPALSPDNGMIFVTDAVLRSNDGQKLSFNRLPDANQFLTGANGNLYARSSHVLAEWRQSGGQAEIVQRIEWQYQLYGVISPPVRSGVTSGSLAWLLYYSSFEDGHFIWLTTEGKVNGEVRFPQRETDIVGLDTDSIAYVCGTNKNSQKAECIASKPGQNSPLWSFTLPQGSFVTGGALGDGVLYVATAEGYLFAINSR